MKRAHPLNKQHGFTLIELLVVVSMLASIASIAVITLDGYEEDAQEQLVQVEMKRIANAIYRFKADTGYFPEKGLFPSNTDTENFDWMFFSPENGSNNEILPWDSGSGRGWHGPYLTMETLSKYATASDNYCYDVTTTFSAAVINDQQKTIESISDKFLRSKKYESGDGCFTIRDDGQWVPKATSGMPYKYSTSYSDNIPQSECVSGTNTCIALISAGEDSTFDTSANSDDIVFVLEKN